MGHGIVLCYIGIGFLASLYYYIFASRANAARERGECDEAIGGEPLLAGEMRDGKGAGGWYVTVADAKAAKGDNWSGFR